MLSKGKEDMASVAKSAAQEALRPEGPHSAGDGCDRPLGDTPWKRFRDERPVYDGWGERHLLTWSVRVGTYDLGCINGDWSVGEPIDGHPDDLWCWLDVNPERHLPAENKPLGCAGEAELSRSAPDTVKSSPPLSTPLTDIEGKKARKVASGAQAMGDALKETAKLGQDNGGLYIQCAETILSLLSELSQVRGERDEVCRQWRDQFEYAITRAQRAEADLRRVTAERDEAERRRKEVQVEHDGLRRSEREWRRKQVAAEAERDRARGALKRVNQILTIPAAEYVPAIPDAWAVIEAALAETGGVGR